MDRDTKLDRSANLSGSLRISVIFQCWLRFYFDKVVSVGEGIKMARDRVVRGPVVASVEEVRKPSDGRQQSTGETCFRHSQKTCEAACLQRNHDLKTFQIKFRAKVHNAFVG